MKSELRKRLIRLLPSALINFEYPDPTRVLGLSTSHWTNVVDWNIAREHGIRFAYIKAFNGMNGPVNFWKENYEGAKKAGLKVGGYTWLYPPSVASPGGQARAFAKFMKDYPCELPACVDFEGTSPSDPNSGDLYGFVKPFEDATGKKPAVYTSPGYWNQYGSHADFWKYYPLWQAQYNHGQADIIKPWTGHKFLQWTQTGKGTDYGVPIYGERACELSYYNGTLDQFEAELEFGSNPLPPSEPPIKGVVMKKGIARIPANIKSVSGVPTGTIATLPVDGWVIGTLSEMGTDLIIDDWYRPTGAKVILPELEDHYKVSITNLYPLTDVTPPPVVIDPIPGENLPPTSDDINVAVDKTAGVITVHITGSVPAAVYVNNEPWQKIP